ncbi:hypothetical protein [Dyella mobilis]|uniref:WYL domain-containing protein n=1 Tax=Dyella mobilis TaxID=1849582 RepID=A0ABS2KN50_9GAMM|nr:hypothetical protein [Dyella mobilis]MBM7131873.1 hypothetical protein [Dyella mobilis]GLQ96145.1 hypothetical protein GCM10007863_05630 [Dyella mobilis]
MKNHYGPSVYYASDKSIRDALNQPKISDKSLQRLLYSRGILLSSENARDYLAGYFSRLNYDYYDQAEIADAMEVQPRRDRTTSRFITTQNDISIFEHAADAIKSEIEKREDGIDINLIDNRLTVSIDYISIDYRRSEFSQVRRQTGVIDVIKSATGYIVRSTQTPYIDERVESFLAEAEKACQGKNFSLSTINLQAVPDHKYRTEFFDLLINGLIGYPLIDVSAAYVFKKHPDPDEIDDDDNVSDDLEDIRIERASLSGKGVHRSEEIKALHNREFYAVRVSWSVADSSQDRFDIDATFSEPESCSGFSYLLRRVHQYIGKGRPPHQRSPLKKEIDTMYSLLEDSATRAMTSIREKYHAK